MGTYLPLLDEAYRQGRMTPDQVLAYRETLRRLKAPLPILDRLNLTRPSVSFDGS